MKQPFHRSGHAQNRIAYIVYHNPAKVRRLIDRHGYVPPGNVHELVQAARQLVLREGRTVVQELVRLHPDRKAILQVEADKAHSSCPVCGRQASPEDQYCGACGQDAYTGSRVLASRRLPLYDLGVHELEERYDEAVRSAKRDPEDKALADEVQRVWNTLRLRRQTEATMDEEEKDPAGLVIAPKDAALVLGLTLVAGGLIGSAWRWTRPEG